MKNFSLIAIAIILLPSLLFAQQPTQAPPTVPPSSKPALRRDRTQRVLYPKIIQYEDERIVSTELLSMLKLSHGGVKKRAIMALARIGYPSSVIALIEVLTSDRNAEMRALAAFALGETESHYAVSALLDRLQLQNEASAEVRARAAEALGKIASNRLAVQTLGQYPINAITENLKQLLPPADQPVSDDAKLIVSMTLSALLRIKHPASVEAIAAQLRSTDADIRWQAANALARIREGIAVAVPSLLALLDDKNAIVRATTARALGVAKDKRAVEGLIRLLGDADERVTANAINALGSIADASAVEPLVALGNKLIAGYRAFNRAKEGVPSEQKLLLLIAAALGNIKDERALTFLKALRFIDGRADSNPEVEIAVAKLGESAFFDIPESATLLHGDWKAMAAFAQGLGQLGTEKAKTILLDLLSGKTYGQPDYRAISDILNAAAQAKVAGLSDILVAKLKSDDVIVRATAATLLGEAGDASDPIYKALKDAFEASRLDTMNDARIAIVEALDKLKRPINVMVLTEPGRDPDYIVRMKAAELIRLNPEQTEVRVQIGKVETGHDRAYWKRVAQLAELKKNPQAVIHTKKGNIRIELFASDAPMTVDNFIQLSKKGFYNNLDFVRVVPNFVVQTGDPRGDQNGGPGYQIRCEINLRQYGTGAVGMALSGKDTGGSQFFITHSPQPHLDGGYTVFGQVTEGMTVVNRLARGDRIEKIEIIDGK
jgi:cyclophilin family peptidyl-prolyl cis-trans isomerase/HEAT repeat protein